MGLFRKKSASSAPVHDPNAPIQVLGAAAPNATPWRNPPARPSPSWVWTWPWATSPTFPRSLPLA